MARLLTILAHREAGAWHDPYWIVPHWKSLGKQPFRNRDLSDLRTSRTYPKCFFGQILRPTIGQHQLPARAVRPSMSVRTWSFGFMIQDQAPSHQAIKELDRLSGRANLQEPFVSRSKSGVSCTFSNKICEQRHLSAKKKNEQPAEKNIMLSPLPDRQSSLEATAGPTQHTGAWKQRHSTRHIGKIFSWVPFL